MKRHFKNKIWFLLFLFCVAACKEPYYPPAIVTQNHYLVVEGRINEGSPTTIVLSRTRNVTDTSGVTGGNTHPIWELNATVNVEDNHGGVAPLPELGDGKYGGINIVLNDQYLYRLRIRTEDGKEYLSSFVPVLHTTPIDSIDWKLANNEVSIYTGTHGNQNAIGYYRWNFVETWEFHAYIFQSLYKFDASDTTLIPRTTPVYYCWQSDSSTNILIGSTAGLQSDIVSSQFLTSIPYHSEKMSVLYSIMVEQYAISQSEYNFWENEKKNTEQLGSLFDPQPSNATGNIQCITNPKELVIGYVGAGDMTKERIFIYNNELPADWNDVEQNCPIFLVPKDSLWYYYGQMGLVPLDMKRGAYRECADCTTRGTNVKPSYWP